MEKPKITALWCNEKHCYIPAYSASAMDAFLEAERKADAKFLEEQAAKIELDIINHNCGSRGLVKGVIAALRGKAKEKSAREKEKEARGA